MRKVEVVRNCLVCNYGGNTEETKESHQEIRVCPKCNGAFVDIWHINKYEHMKVDMNGRKEKIDSIELEVRGQLSEALEEIKEMKSLNQKLDNLERVVAINKFIS